MARIELLAPAGDLTKAKVAYLYGADAVYVGGKSFSLRARASNFDLADLKELAEFKNKLNKKLYVTLNIIPHDADLEGLDEYIKALDDMGVDAAIVSSNYIIERIQKIAKHMEVHLSTQKSVTNLASIKYYKAKGVTRVVLAREVTYDEMRQLAQNAPLELEVFIHGGMCASFSGHCVLSNHMTNRDANRGGCAHSCRWNYSLVKDGEIDVATFNISSKDLMAVPFINKLIELNIASLKIEGRLKSAYYLACVVRSYRLLIDTYYQNGTLTEADFMKATKEIKKAENREVSIGFYQGLPTVNEQLYDNRVEIPTQEYIACVISYDALTNTAVIEQRNHFSLGEKVEVMTPIELWRFTIDEMFDAETKEPLEVAPHPLQRIIIHPPFPLAPFDMIRKIQE